MATHKLDLDTDAGELIIRAGDVHRTATAPHRVSASEWEEALKQLDKRVTNSITLGMTVRSLDLDGTDSTKAKLLRDALTSKKLEFLCDLSICDAHLGGSGVTPRLLAALASVPAFAKPHAEAWDPMETEANPPQGARLCLMRNDLSDDDLSGDGLSPLRGLIELSLSGNQYITDPGFARVGTLAPNARRLFLGRTGITVGQTIEKLIKKCWPMLDALALNGCPIDFDRLANALHLRSNEGKNLKPRRHGANNEIVEEAHVYCHLDVREVYTATPSKIRDLRERMKKYSRSSAMKGYVGWIHEQYFSGGREKAEGGLVLRHAFEEEMRVRMCVSLEGREDISDGRGGPYYIEFTEVPQLASVDEIVKSVVRASNGRAPEGRIEEQQAEASAKGDSARFEKTVMDSFKVRSFPFSNGDPQGRLFRELYVECGEVRLEPGVFVSRALGSLLPRTAAEAWAAVRKFDGELGLPTLVERKRLVEVELRMRLAAKGNAQITYQEPPPAASGGNAAGKKRARDERYTV